MPDFDVDFCYERRSEVIDYVIRKYGADHVAQIVTFGTMAARAVIRDVGRVLDMPYQQVDAVAKLVPMELKMTLQKALKTSRELARQYEQDPSVHELIDMALKLEGMPRHASTHAAVSYTHLAHVQHNGGALKRQFAVPGKLQQAHQQIGRNIVDAIIADVLQRVHEMCIRDRICCMRESSLRR